MSMLLIVRRQQTLWFGNQEWELADKVSITSYFGFTTLKTFAFAHSGYSHLNAGALRVTQYGTGVVMAVAAEGIFEWGWSKPIYEGPESAGPPLGAEGPYFSDLPDSHQRYIRCKAVPCIFYGGGGQLPLLPPPSSAALASWGKARNTECFVNH